MGRLVSPSGPVGEEGAEALGLGGEEGRTAIRSEVPAVAEEVRFRGADFAEGAFVVGELADEPEDGGGVGRGGRADS